MRHDHQTSVMYSQNLQDLLYVHDHHELHAHVRVHHVRGELHAHVRFYELEQFRVMLFVNALLKVF